MPKKKFASEEQYHTAVNDIEWQARISHERYTEEMRLRMNKAKEKYNTSSLDDAFFLLKLFEQKIEEHNGRCKQQAGRMKTTYYKRDNIAE